MSILKSFHVENDPSVSLTTNSMIKETHSDGKTSSLTLDDCSMRSSINDEKLIEFQLKTNSFNRKIQIRTKQEEQICQRKDSSPTSTSLPLMTCYTTTEYSSPHRITIQQQTTSTKTPSPIQNIRLRVNSTNDDKKPIETPLSPLSSPISIRKCFETKSPSLSRRPLLEFVSDENSPTLKSDSPSLIPTLEQISLSNDKTTILPAKTLNPFRPKIIHRKYQDQIGLFQSIDQEQTNEKIFSTISPSNDDQINKTTNPKEIPSSTTTKTDPTNSTNSTSLTSSSPSQTTISTTDDKHEAKRKAIAMQMYDTENSYVEALKNLVTKYYLPMKDKAIVSNDLINDIFYKIPEIHIHHTAFLISLSQKLTEWDNKQTVGDLLLQMFTRTSVIETYTSFVNNYKTAQLAIRLCRDFSSFNKFLEQQAKDHRGRLTLRDLIIQPVQRIPRYELYLKDFLRCTNVNHPDYPLLLKAQSEIHSLAEQIDQVQREVGSTELTMNNHSLELIQDIIDNLSDLVHPDRYYIRHDSVTIQSSSGVKKDRFLFLFNDLMLITSCKRRSGTLTKKSANSIIINSPSGKQYIDNAKHKLIMKIPLETLDLAEDRIKKTRRSITTPPLSIKSHSKSHDQHRHLEDDVLILGQMTDLAKTITVPHQQLDESIRETLETVHKQLNDEGNPRGQTPEPISHSDLSQTKVLNIELIFHTSERTETIDVLFPSNEQKSSWEKTFLEAKKVLFEISAGRRNIVFEDLLRLPQNRPGSEFSCGISRMNSDDLWICNSEGEVILVDLESNLQLKCSNSITSSRINSIIYVPSFDERKKKSSLRNETNKKEKHFNDEDETNVNSLFDFDSSDEEENLSQKYSDEDLTSLNHSEHLFITNSDKSTFIQHQNHQDEHVFDTRESTIWLATQNDGLLIYRCSQTKKFIGRKNRFCKPFSSPIFVILYTHNKVFLGLNHGQLAVFRRERNGFWDLDNPTICSIEENSSSNIEIRTESIDDENNSTGISIIGLVAGRLWCVIRDRIFIVCPNSLVVQHSFVVDDYHRHVHCLVTGGSSMHHVWIACQGSQDIRLYHSTHFTSLLEINIRTAVTQKLQICDDIIRAHKLGCLHVTTLYICKETLWIGTSAGILLNVSLSQLMDPSTTNGINKLTGNSLQLKALPYGHAGPVRFILSIDRTISSDNDVEGKTFQTSIFTMGDGFEDYQQNDENLGKDDSFSHLILWQLSKSSPSPSTTSTAVTLTN